VLPERLTRFHALLVAATLVTAAIVMLSSGPARLALLVAVVAVTSALATLGVMWPQWQFFGRTLCRGATGRRQVALTFDDGPDPEATTALLALLARRRVPATFFCVGERVARHGDIVRRMADDGHQVENHSQRHAFGTNLLSVTRLRRELVEAQTEITRATGRSPRFFRPPMGLTNGRVFRVAGELGLAVTGWSARGLDRRADPAARIVGRLLRRLRPGAILLLHDGGVPAARLLAVTEMLIDKLEAQGYQCVRLDNLIACGRNA
jgi:peptidoglycan-N-acetylglucosamine deacetylase